MKSLVEFINEANNSEKNAKIIEFFEEIFSKMKINETGNLYRADKETYCDELFKLLNDSKKSVSYAAAKKADAFITISCPKQIISFERLPRKEFFIWSNNEIFNTKKGDKADILNIDYDTLKASNFPGKDYLTMKFKSSTSKFWTLSSDTVNKIADLWNKYSK